jgi:ketosteroid isomerase-like protein
MSHENVELVRDAYAATNEHDFERMRSLYAEDVELVVHVPGIRAGTFRGLDAAGGWLGDWLGTFEHDARFEEVELTELPDGSVLSVARFQGRGKGSGIEVNGTVVWLYGLREGKIIRVDGYASRAEALEAVGLSE